MTEVLFPKLRAFFRIKILETELFYIDYWSGVHLLVCYMLFFYGVTLITTVFLLILFERWENSKFNNIFRKEVNKDSLTDILIGVGGWYLGGF